MIHDVEGPDGKIIKIEGPEDATDDELISAARSYYQQSKPAAAKPAAKAESDAIVPGQMPALSKPEDLAKQNAARAPGAKQEETTQPPPAQSVFEPLSRGEFGEAWQNIPETTRDLALYGTPPVAAGLAAAGMGLKYLKSKFGDDSQITPTGNGIRARTIGGTAPTPTTGGAERIEPTFNPKEAKIAADIENKYGFSWKDIKSNFGVSDVTITNPLEAQMLADSYKNQQAAPTTAPEAPAAPTTAAPESKMTFTAEILKSNNPGQTEWDISGTKMNAEQVAEWLNTGAEPKDIVARSQTPAPVAPAAPTPAAPAPVAETKAPAPPPAETPKAAVPPTTEKPAKKTGRPAANTLEPTTFRGDLGPGDNWLYNTAGPERRRAILAEFNEGKPAKDYKTAQEIYKKYQEKYPKDMFGPVLPVEEAKARGIKPPEPYGKLGKVAKAGGVAGLALTAAEMANAAQQSKAGNDAPLRESIFNLLGMIPGLGTAFTAGTFSGGTNEGEMEELAARRKMAPEITKR